MSKLFRSIFRRWLIFPAIALGFLVWINSLQIQRVRYTTSLFGDVPKWSPASATGYADGTRELIVPARNNATYHLIAQTQQMFARGEWRVRQVDYDNAPFGRNVNSASPSRWWLGFIAWLDHSLLSHRPLGAAVEQAALFADPLLHLLLWVTMTVFVARRFGVRPAVLISLGLATLYPFVGSFAPGAPDDQGLAQFCAMGSVLLLLAGVVRVPVAVSENSNAEKALDGVTAERQTRRWFAYAGIVGALGLWISVATMVPLLVGIGVGAIAAAWFARDSAAKGPGHSASFTPWRVWALNGASTILVTYFLEFYPAHLGSWELQCIHPLYGLAWLGMGELLARTTAWIQGEKPKWNVGTIGAFTLALAAVAAVPVVMKKTHDQGFLAVSTSSFRLTKLPAAPVETSLKTWLHHGDVSSQAWLTFLPVALVLLAGWLLVRLRGQSSSRVALALALGPLLIALGFACWRMSWWSTFDGLLLVSLAALTAPLSQTIVPRPVRWFSCGLAGMILVLGAMQLLWSVRTEKKDTLNEAEFTGLIDRDLGRWLAKHAGPGGAVILAPPRETTALIYYGGLRGLGTLAWENQDGISAAIRVVSASTPEEAKELIDRRGIKYIVIPSWDSYLDQYARIGMGQLDGTFLVRLHGWKLTPWLKPVPYQLPTIAGFEGQSVKIFEVVEDQEDPVALSRVAEYFIEMERLDQASAVAQALRRFPSDLGALVARAQVEIARGDTAAFGRTVELLRPRLAAKGDRNLPWDRRASLAVVLARAKLTDLARAQVQRCITEIDETNVRSLTTGSLYRLLVLSQAFGFPVNDQRLRELTFELLPADLRAHLRR